MLLAPSADAFRIFFLIALSSISLSTLVHAQGESSADGRLRALISQYDSLLTIEDKFQLVPVISKQSKHITSEFARTLESKRLDESDATVLLQDGTKVIVRSRKYLVELIEQRMHR